MPIPNEMSGEISVDDAKRLYESKWWEGEPARVVALAQLRQSLLCMPFAEFHRVTEEALGCPVWTHEFADPKNLVRRIEENDTEPRNPLESIVDVMNKVKS